jgi:hypothetical protein
MRSPGVGAKPAVEEEEDMKDLLSISGMTQAEDGTLLFHDQVVKSVTGVGTGKKIQLPHGSAADGSGEVEGTGNNFPPQEDEYDGSGEGQDFGLPQAYKVENDDDVM